HNKLHQLASSPSKQQPKLPFPYQALSITTLINKIHELLNHFEREFSDFRHFSRYVIDSAVQDQDEVILNNLIIEEKDSEERQGFDEMRDKVKKLVVKEMGKFKQN
ncbi:MAG: hypothetical protein EZS28_052390, partial [Streblomastix strix]